MTYVGTLKNKKSNNFKKDFLGIFLPRKTRNLGDTMYDFTKELTTNSHVPKPNKAVILLLPMHLSESVDNNTGKPEIYNF